MWILIQIVWSLINLYFLALQGLCKAVKAHFAPVRTQTEQEEVLAVVREAAGGGGGGLMRRF